MTLSEQEFRTLKKAVSGGANTRHFSQLQLQIINKMVGEGLMVIASPTLDVEGNAIQKIKITEKGRLMFEKEKKAREKQYS